ncbi:MAG: hypothetical protein ACI4DS_05385 [Eubacterium sp.]
MNKLRDKSGFIEHMKIQASGESEITHEFEFGEGVIYGNSA